MSTLPFSPGVHLHESREQRGALLRLPVSCGTKRAHVRHHFEAGHAAAAGLAPEMFLCSEFSVARRLAKEKKTFPATAEHLPWERGWQLTTPHGPTEACVAEMPYTGRADKCGSCPLCQLLRTAAARELGPEASGRP